MKIILFLIAFCQVFVFSCKQKKKTLTNLSYNNCSLINVKPLNVTNNHKNTDVLEIRYLSDSIEVSGYIVKPKHISENEKLPLIVYNRGGNRDFGAIMKSSLNYLRYLSSQGYVIMASQYRGNSLSKGVDEFGGKDVNDITCLIEIAKGLDYIDSENIGALGYSRGGLMTYILSKQTDAIKTAIVVGAPTDLFLAAKNRPDLYKGVFVELIGDSISKKQEFINRSASYWADKLNEPLLILHGTEDKRVSIKHAEKLVDSVEKYSNESIKHYFIKGGSHSLSNFKKMREDTISGWFNHYLKN